MGIKRKSFCTFCFNVVVNEFKEIGEIVNRIFDAFSLEPDLDASVNTVVCHQCLEIAKKCLRFKYKCLYTEKIVLEFVTVREKIKLDIEDMYEMSKQSKHDKTVGRFLNICRLCITHVKQSCYVSLCDIMDTSVMGLLPEIDLDIVENPVVCTNCREDLKCYLKFIKSIHRVNEEKKHQKENCTTLDETRLFINCTINSSKKFIEEEPDNEFREEFEETDEEKLDNATLENGTECFETQTWPALHQCAVCQFNTIHKGYLKTHTLQKHTSESKEYKCTLCDYKAEYLPSILEHVSVHKLNNNFSFKKHGFIYTDLRDNNTKYKYSLIKHISLKKSPR